jgi:hypothetical protein
VKINIDKVLIVRILRNLDTNVRMKVKDTVIQWWIYLVIYFGNKINSEENLNREISRRIQSSLFYQIAKETVWNRDTEQNSA